MPRFRSAILMLIALLAGSCPALGAPLFVGVLEDKGVRVAFQKTGTGWDVASAECADIACLAHISASYPARIDWTVAFDGRRLGTLAARSPSAYESFSDVGLQTLVQPELASQVRGAAEKFAGGMGVVPARRPLVTVSQPNTADPDGWKPVRLDPRSMAVLRLAFHRQFPAERNCRNPIENKALPWSYRDSDIRIRETYADRRGRRIANLMLIHDRCDGPAEGGFESQTFVLSPDGKAVALDRGLTLVDAGDFDRDGHSELLFQIARYNRGGYELVYDNLRKHASFIFSYH